MPKPRKSPRNTDGPPPNEKGRSVRALRPFFVSVKVSSAKVGGRSDHAEKAFPERRLVHRLDLAVLHHPHGRIGVRLRRGPAVRTAATKWHARHWSTPDVGICMYYGVKNAHFVRSVPEFSVGTKGSHRARRKRRGNPKGSPRDAILQVCGNRGAVPQPATRSRCFPSMPRALAGQAIRPSGAVRSRCRRATG